VGSADADFAYSVPGLGRFRANAFRQRGSVALVFRLVRTSAASFGQLGVPDVVGRLALEHRGLVLVTGPTGSGKTTTLAAMIDHINTTRECHIITIEDPIEVLHSDKKAIISQREVRSDTLDFTAALRGAMRQDPDVIMVGEMRDIETVRAALSAAETGHLVLATLHTVDAQDTINRIIDFFTPHEQSQVRATLSQTLRGIISQRLVRRGDGSGRTLAAEIMVNHGRIAEAIVDPSSQPPILDLITDGEYYKMQTFDQHLFQLVQEQTVTVDDAVAIATRPHDLLVSLRNAGVIV
jgi:twitching motility protein PilT